MTDSNCQRANIESEVDRLCGGSDRVGLREHALAYLLFSEGMQIDVRCPKCLTILEVIPFPQRNGVDIRCRCGTCSGSMRGL
jgi:hypothetical protein